MSCKQIQIPILKTKLYYWFMLTMVTYYDYNTLAGLTGVARAFTTAQPPPPPPPLPLPYRPAPPTPAPPAPAPQEHSYNFNPSTTGPDQTPQEHLTILTPPRPVPSRPRPTCNVSALYLENCANSLRQTETDRDRQAILFIEIGKYALKLYCCVNEYCIVLEHPLYSSDNSDTDD